MKLSAIASPAPRAHSARKVPAVGHIEGDRICPGLLRFCNVSCARCELTCACGVLSAQAQGCRGLTGALITSLGMGLPRHVSFPIAASCVLGLGAVVAIVIGGRVAVHSDSDGAERNQMISDLALPTHPPKLFQLEEQRAQKLNALAATADRVEVSVLASHLEAQGPPAVATRTVRGELARQLGEAWAALHISCDGMRQPMCVFRPTYSLRFFSADQLTIQASPCWSCGQVQASAGPAAEESYACIFDGTEPGSQALRSRLAALFPRMDSTQERMDSAEPSPASPLSWGPARIQGELRPEDLDKALPLTRLAYCYERELPAHPALAGELVIGLVLPAKKPRATLISSTLDNPKLVECVLATMSSLDISPSPRKQSRITLPLKYSPQFDAKRYELY